MHAGRAADIGTTTAKTQNSRSKALVYRWYRPIRIAGRMSWNR
jgi:hypothetical protein